ncbi:SDR family NAD(P)-dependent oxidoreductase [Streptomyces sp. NPDC054813]
MVTGAAGGIGRATAQLLGERGAQVIVSGRNTERGKRVVVGIRAAGGKTDFVQADRSGAAGARSLAGAAGELAGGIDILVNSTGTYPSLASTDTHR